MNKVGAGITLKKVLLILIPLLVAGGVVILLLNNKADNKVAKKEALDKEIVQEAKTNASSSRASSSRVNPTPSPTPDPTPTPEATATLTYSANGLAGAKVPAAITMRTTDAVVLPTTKSSSDIVAPAGYEFKCWCSDAKCSKELDTTYKAKGVEPQAATIYAKWTSTLKFDANGGTDAPSDVTLLKAGQVKLDKVPTKDRYDFVGWATTDTATEAEYEKGDVFKKDGEYKPDTILYAVWTPHVYVLRYTGNGLDNAQVPAPVIMEVEDEIKCAGTASRNGYDFKGWYRTQECTGEEVAQGTILKAAGELPVDIKLYAKWESTLTYNSNVDGSDPAQPTGVPTATTTMNKKDATTTAAAPTRTGYDFVGWSEKADAKSTDTADIIAASSTYKVANAYKPTKTLYAIWKSTLTYDDNVDATDPIKVTGMPKTLTETMNKASKTKITTATPVGKIEDGTKTWTFVGWSEEKDAKEGGTDKIYKSGDEYKAENAYKPTKTLYAIWQSTITFDKNTTEDVGNMPATNPIKMYRKDDVSIPDNVLTRTNWHFAGWSTSKTATTAEFKPGDPYKATDKYAASVTLYAVWDSLKVGDLIKLDAISSQAGEEIYRVVAMKDNNPTLLAMASYGKVKYNTDTTSNTTTFNVLGGTTKTGQQYKDSVLDTTMTNFYNEMTTSTDNNVKSKVKSKSLTQTIYSRSYTDPGTSEGVSSVPGTLIYNGEETTYYIRNEGSITGPTRYVYALGTEDVVSYLTAIGQPLHYDNIRTMFWNSTAKVAEYCWLRSANTWGSWNAFYVARNEGDISTTDANETYHARPAFEIDLIGLTYSKVPNISFNKNTDDAVTGMPLDINAATTTMPDNQLVRAKWHFAGWAKEKGATTPDYLPGATVDLSSITTDTTLYAVWDFQVGDLVKLDAISSQAGEETYRVVEMNGNNATLLAMASYGDVAYNKYPDYMEDEHQTTFSNGSKGQKYDGSTLDSKMTEFYNEMTETADNNVKAKVISKTITQTIYTWSDSPGDAQGISYSYDGDDTYNIANKGTANSGSISRKVYALGIEDVVRYVNIVSDQTPKLHYKVIWKMFWNQETPPGEVFCWLRSATTNPDPIWLSYLSATGIYGYSGNVTENNAMVAEGQARPAFEIDLIGLTYSKAS